MECVLADLLTAPPAVALPSAIPDWNALAALAEEEGVAALLHETARPLQGVIPGDAWERLAICHREAVYTSLLYQSVCDRLCRQWQAAGIPAILLKGAALAYQCYEDPATRVMVDLDLLVHERHIAPAARCLERDGFLLEEGVLGSQPYSPRSHLVYRHRSTRAVVELHWRLNVLGRAEPVAAREIWRDAVPLQEGAARAMRLGHAIPYLCAHLVLQHQSARLLWLFDLHRALLTAGAEEEPVLRESATRWGVAPTTACALLQCRELFGTPLAPDLADWATRVAGRGGLQARTARLVLTRGAAALPSPDLLDVVMRRDWSLIRALFPTPDELRRRLGLGPRERVLPAYVRLMQRHVRLGLPHIRRLWNCRRGMGS